MESEDDAVVVPLVPTDVEPSTEVMLRMLLNREAVIISRDSSTAQRLPSGMIAQASGAFAKAVGQAVGRTGQGTASSGLYRVILPSGSVARDLIPAVGGGFRGLVRAAGSTSIAGHARLIPAAAGAGAALAAGPLIATVGLAVAGEMLAQHQMNKKLASIQASVVDLKVRMNDQDRSVLTTASQQARKVASYLLDRAHIPSISSAAHAFGDLDTLTNAYIDRLDRWSEVSQRHQSLERVYAPDLMRALVGKRDNQTQEFEQMVAQTYEALALRARVVVLEKIAAEFSNGDRSLPNVERILRSELSTYADRQTQLVTLLDDLNVLQMDASKVPIAFAGKNTLGARTSFARLARALHNTPDSLPLLSQADQTMIELVPSADGLSVVQPANE